MQFIQAQNAMGEVRIQVKLTNALDEGLYSAKKIPREQVRSFSADAMIDTGAVHYRPTACRSTTRIAYSRQTSCIIRGWAKGIR